MTEKVTETFFLPDEIDRESSHIPADIYNTAHNLLARSDYDCVFVPIRSLQVFAVVTGDEIVFVDSLSYTSVDDEGGRLIMLTWRFSHVSDRGSLDEPVDCELIYHHETGRRWQDRMIVEFRSSLEEYDRLYREENMPAEGARIIRLEKNR